MPEFIEDDAGSVSSDTMRNTDVAEPDAQSAKQERFIALIENLVLRDLVQQSVGTEQTIYLKHHKTLFDRRNTEQAINDINHAVFQSDMTQEKYKLLLNDVGINLSDEDLTLAFNEFEKSFQANLLTAEKEQWLEVFEVIYPVLRQFQSSISAPKKSDFLAALKNKSPSERYYQIQAHIKKHTEASKVSRSTQAAKLTNDQINYLGEDSHRSSFTLHVRIAQVLTVNFEPIKAVLEKYSALLGTPLDNRGAKSARIRIDAYKYQYHKLKKESKTPSILQSNVIQQLENMTLRQQDQFIAQYVSDYPSSRLAKAKHFVDNQTFDATKEQMLAVFKVVYEVLKNLKSEERPTVNAKALSAKLNDSELTELEKYQSIGVATQEVNSHAEIAWKITEAYQCVSDKTVGNLSLIIQRALVMTFEEASTLRSNPPPERSEGDGNLVFFVKNSEPKAKYYSSKIVSLLDENSIIFRPCQESIDMERKVKCFEAIHLALQYTASGYPSQEFRNALKQLRTPAEKYARIKAHADANPDSRSATARNLMERVFLKSTEENYLERDALLTEIQALQPEKVSLFSASRGDKMKEIIDQYIEEEKNTCEMKVNSEESLPRTENTFS
jgi:hypothetical protein